MQFGRRQPGAAGVAPPTDWDDDEQAARYVVATFVVAGQRPSSDPQAAALLPSIVERAQIVDHTFSDEVGWSLGDVDGPVLLFAVAFDDEGTAADRSSEMSRWLDGWVATPTDPLAGQVADQLVPGSVPWTDLVSVESAEARGSVVVVRLRPTEAAPASAVWMATTLGPAGQILSEPQEAVRQNC